MTGSTCPECAVVLDRDGLCPQCLLALGLGGQKPDAADAGQADPVAVGPYRIVERLGEGGMGVVYLADQAEPIRRRVAIKLIKLGMNSQEIVSRFENERQALERMDHPGIAGVVDAGSTAEGRPYFVMEHVPGVPITTYCDRRRLDTRARVELFVDVCRAIEHAHQRGVMHRDLKPSNVLVTEIDGVPRAKVIDFGVAKATAGRSTERTAVTRLGRIVGTPEYMSPEQAHGGESRVDTRTDVYSLGVLLYELLVGALPFEQERLERLGIEEQLRVIREDEPPSPSQRVATLGDRSATAARDRRTEPRSLTRVLRGELDWIVMRAIEKDAERRYASAADLANDVVRYLRGEAVWAGPPGTLYRLRRFARRNRNGLAIAGAVAVTGIALTAFYTVQLRQQRDRAEREATKARQVVRFLTSLFGGADPRANAGRDVQVTDLLARGASRLETELAEQPEVWAEIAGSLGKIHTSLGEHALARGFLERSLANLTALYGESHLAVAEALTALAQLDYLQGQHDDALRRLRTALEIHGAQRDADVTAEGLVRRDLAVTLFAAGDVAAAVAEGRQALALLESRGQPPDAALIDTMGNVGYLLLHFNDLEGAAPLLERGLRLARDVLGDRHPDLSYHLDYNAQLRERAGDSQGALAAAREALELRTAVLGEDHPQTAESLHNVAVRSQATGDLEAAEGYYRRALDARRRAFGNRHRQVAITLYSLALLLERRLELDEAQRLYEEAAEIQLEVLGERHYVRARTLVRLGALSLKRSDPRTAESALREALGIARAALPPGHPQGATALLWLGWTLILTDRTPEAEDLLREALAIRRDNEVAGSLQIAEAEVVLAACLVRMGRAAEARQLFDDNAPRLIEALGPDAWLSRQIEATRGLLRDQSGAGPQVGA